MFRHLCFRPLSCPAHLDRPVSLPASGRTTAGRHQRAGGASPGRPITPQPTLRFVPPPTSFRLESNTAHMFRETASDQAMAMTSLTQNP